MAAPFDPFCEWLEIEPHEHPVDHYRLLGLRRFESDPEMIEAAADERMKKTRSFQTGPRGRFTQPILNALSQARLCLADPEERASYDGQLRSAEQVESEHPEGQPVAKTVFQDLYWSVDGLGIRERSKMPWIIAAVVLVAAVGIGLIIREGRSGTDPPEEPNGNQQEVVKKKRGKEKLKPKRLLVQQEETGEVHLSPSTAELVGGNMQRDLEKNEVYGWKETSDLVRWSFRIAAKPGTYTVKVEYAADEQWEGGEYKLQLDEEKAAFEDVVPGDSQVDEQFLFIRSTGPHTLTLRASRITGDELMRLRSIQLVPYVRE
ncbi:MAG: hypothetical protein VB855_15970 [Pirellulaceae bacterium]